MRRVVILFVVAAVLAGLAVNGALAASIVHPQFLVLQAYAVKPTPAVKFTGFGGAVAVDRAALPGFFDIEPGLNWQNYVSAFRAAQPYTLKTVVLTKKTPQPIQCSEVYAARTFSQMGSSIRLRWPLMYEAPGTIWTLTILYGTKNMWTDPSQTIPSTVHQDVWTWKVDTTWDSVSDLMVLFHELPFGLDEVPIISDEMLYPQLQSFIAAAKASCAVGDKTGASTYLGNFELEVADACIGSSPTSPIITGVGTGIAQTSENPACCKLLIDAEALFAKYGLVSFY
jgi:hypothetical protein